MNSAENQSLFPIRPSRLIGNVIASLCLVLLGSTFTRAGAVTVFDGSKKIIVRITDSMQPAQKLEERVHRLVGNESTFYFLKHFGRFTGVGYDDEGNFVVNPLSHGGRDSWLDPKHLAATIEEAKSLHCGGEDCEVILFCPSGIGHEQQFIADTTDTAQVNEALRRVEFMCERIIESGVDQVFWSNNSYAFAHERFPGHVLKVIREFNERNQGKPYKALDIMTATKAEYPIGNNWDMFHPIGYTRELTSHLYFKALCENDGIEVPSWSEDMIAQAKAKDMEDYAQAEYLGPRSGRYKLGDTIWVEWKADPSINQMRGPSFCLVRTDTLVEKLLQSYNMEHHHIPTENLGWRTHFRDTSQYWERYPYVVTEKTFDFGRTTFDCPIPVFISLGIDGLLGHSSYPHIDNPDSMIILYPSDTIDPNIPIYPEALYGPVSASPSMSNAVATGASGDLPTIKQTKRGIVVRNVTGGRYNIEVIDTRGRLCYQAPIDVGAECVVPISRTADGVYIVSFRAVETDRSRPTVTMPIFSGVAPGR